MYRGTPQQNGQSLSLGGKQKNGPFSPEEQSNTHGDREGTAVVGTGGGCLFWEFTNGEFAFTTPQTGSIVFFTDTTPAFYRSSYLVLGVGTSRRGLQLVQLLSHNSVEQPLLRRLRVNHLGFEEKLALAVVLKPVPLALAHEAVGTLRHGIGQSGWVYYSP